jgi:putative DNA primase/helicase
LACLRKEKDDNTGYVAFKDVLLNLNTFETEPFDILKFVTFHFDCNYADTEMEIPTFTEYLKTSLVDKKNVLATDYELISLVQEMFGVFLLDNMDTSAAFFLVGTGSNGKSIMTMILENMFGIEYCSAYSIQSLTTKQFTMPGIIGKKINISNEEESKYMQADKFKALVTGDLVEAEHKFGKSFAFKPKTKFIFGTNAMLTFDGINYGLKRRLKFIPFNRKFKPGEGIPFNKFKAMLLVEMPGIIGWAIEGAKRIMDNNYVFTVSKASVRSSQDFEDEVSSALRFFRECYEIDNTGFVPNDQIYDHYKEWCTKNGKKPANKFGFLKDIGDNVDDIEKKYGRIAGKSQRGINATQLTVKHDDEDIEEYEEVISTPAPIQAVIDF